MSPPYLYKVTPPLGALSPYLKKRALLTFGSRSASAKKKIKGRLALKKKRESSFFLNGCSLKTIRLAAVLIFNALLDAYIA